MFFILIHLFMNRITILKYSLLVIFQVITVQYSFSQSLIEPCVFDVIHKDKLLNDVEYKQKTLDFENYLLKNKTQLKTTSTDYKVPVVVHVMGDGTSLTSITDEEIQNALYSLNERYRKIPGSLGDGNGVDVTLEFSLAVRDPNGNCTNGIVRYDLSGNPTYVSDGVQRNTAGISDATLKAYSYWNSAQYYNIWLVSQIDGNNGGSGVQGYAYFASAHGTTYDGTLILASKFKLSNNTTATHEIGHAFNLYHTFEGDNSGSNCPVNNSCSSDGDRVCDTPPHIRSGSDCLAGTNSCDGGSSNDLYIHNYMDYSSDACQSEFTAGQATRIIAAMTTTRNSFLETNGNMSLVPVTSPTIEFTATSNFVCTNSEITLVDRSTCIPNSYVNSGSYSTISHLWTIENGGTILTSTDQNPTINFSIPGTYNVTLAVTTSFGTVTETKSNFIYVGTAPSVPCQPSTLNSSNYWQTINNVTFNTINNTTDSYTNDGYSDYRCTGATIVNSGQSYNLSLSLRSYSLDEVVEVYIDYNNDNTLSPLEMIYSGSIASDAVNGNTGVLTSSITIPANTVTDTPLLMRVIGEALSISSAERACTSSYSIGDVEDYTVIVKSSCTNSTADVGVDSSICSSSSFTASATATNGTILWTSSGTGSFDDATLEDVTYNPSAADITSGTVTLTMTVTNPDVCSGASDDLVLSITGLPSADAGIDGSICSDVTFTALASATNGSILWTTSGTGSFADATVEDATYTPSASDVTTGVITLTMTVSSGGCVDATDNTILTIQSAPTADAGVDASICSSSTFTASATTTNGTILWATSGDGTFNDATLEDPIYSPGVGDIASGSTTLTITVSNGTCIDVSDNLILTITGNSTSDAGIDKTICSSSTFTALATAANGTVLWTTSGDGTFDDDSLEDATYTPGVTDVNNGTVNLTMTVSNGGCVDATDVIVVSIDPSSVANAGVDVPYCSSSTFTAVATATNGTILWTTSGDGTFDDATLEDVTYSPSLNDISNGSVVLTMSVTNTGVCSNVSDNLTLSLAGSPIADAGFDQDICESSTFTADATATNGTVLWTTSGSGTFNDVTLEDPIYTPSTADIINGTATLTMTVSIGGCADAVDNLNLSISNLSIADAGVDASVCNLSNTTYTALATATNGAILWTTSGSGTFNNATLEDVTYTPSTSDLTTGSVLLSMDVTNAGACPGASDSFTLSFGANSTADAGVDVTICSNSDLSTSATGSNGLYSWTSSGTGAFDDASIESPKYTPSLTDISNGSVVLTMNVVNQNGCQDASDNITLTIDEYPNISFTTLMNQNFCIDNSVQIESIVSNGNISWVTSGDGLIDNASVPNINYSPGTNDINSGQVSFTLNVSNGIVCPVVTDQITIQISQSPNAPTVNLTDTCGSSKMEIIGNGNYTWSNGATGNSITVNQIGNYYVYETVGGCISSISSLVASPLSIPTVSLDPFNILCETDGKIILSGGLPLGGEYSFNGTPVASFSPSSAGVGTHTIRYTYSNQNGCSASAVSNINVGCTGVSEKGDLENLIVYPNPTNGILHVVASENVLNITISDQSGRVVDHFEVEQAKTSRDVSHLSNGIYYLDVQTNSTHKRLKFSVVQ